MNSPFMNSPPGPKRRYFVGFLPELRRDPFGFMAACAREYGDIFAINAAGHQFVIVTHPEAIEELLVARAHHFTKSTRVKHDLIPIIGEGVLLSDGERWVHHRHLLQSAFRRTRLAGYGETVVDCAQRAIADWKDGDIRDVYADVMGLTEAIIAKTLFGLDVRDPAHRVGTALQAAMKEIRPQGVPFSWLPDWLPSPTRARNRKAIARLDQMVSDIIASRRASAATGQDLISILLHTSVSGNGYRMSDRQIRDEVLTLFLAGQETTAVALPCIWCLLNEHPDIEALLLAEIDGLPKERSTSLADFSQLPYAEMVIKESLRLYPPASAIFRSARDSCEFGGYRIESGATIVVPQWVVHRDARWFQDPEQFRPTRWEGDFASRLPRYAYFPFGGGTRRCLGNIFALMALRLLLLTIGQQFRLGVSLGESLTQITNNKRGTPRLRMTVTRRRIGRGIPGNANQSTD